MYRRHTHSRRRRRCSPLNDWMVIPFERTGRHCGAVEPLEQRLVASLKDGSPTSAVVLPKLVARQWAAAHAAKAFCVCDWRCGTCSSDSGSNNLITSRQNARSHRTCQVGVVQVGVVGGRKQWVASPFAQRRNSVCALKSVESEFVLWRIERLGFSFYVDSSLALSSVSFDPWSLFCGR